jgi:plasmid stabilization system protein ParE
VLASSPVVVETLRAASDEMAEAAAWYEEQRPGIGERFLSRVQQAVGRIEAFPKIGAPWSLRHPDVRKHAVTGFPYYIIYVTEPALTVIAVAHMKRRPGYWRSRLRP